MDIMKIVKKEAIKRGVDIEEIMKKARVEYEEEKIRRVEERKSRRGE